MSAVRSLGGEDWFQLGDGDLALHVLRSQRRQRGDPLSTIIAAFASAWGIAAQVLPMTDDVVATKVETDEGMLDYQHKSEEHTSELQSLMRISSAVFCLIKKKETDITHL